MEMNEVTTLPKVFLVDCLKECGGCDGEESIELRADPDKEQAEGYCIKCGKHWTVAKKDLKIIQTLVQSEEGQIDRDTMLITKHVVFDTLGVKPYPFKYDSDKVAIEVVLEKLIPTIKQLSEQYDIIEPHIPMLSALFDVCNKELEKDNPDFEPVRIMMTRVINAHIEATRCLSSLDGGKSERSEFIEEVMNELINA